MTLLVIASGPDIWVAAAISVWQAKSWPRYLVTTLLTSTAIVALRTAEGYALRADGYLPDPFALYLFWAVFFLSGIGAAIRLGLFKPFDER